MTIKLYVGGLAYSVTDQELGNYFATHGSVTNARVIKDHASGRSKGFGFVEMENASEGQAAIEALNGTELNGRAIQVNEARPQEERRSTGSRSRPANSRDRHPRRY